MSMCASKEYISLILPYEKVVPTINAHYTDIMLIYKYTVPSDSIRMAWLITWKLLWLIATQKEHTGPILWDGTVTDLRICKSFFKSTFVINIYWHIYNATGFLFLWVSSVFIQLPSETSALRLELCLLFWLYCSVRTRSCCCMFAVPLGESAVKAVSDLSAVLDYKCKAFYFITWYNEKIAHFFI